jgi:mono/diheme cytochrome c family protein
MRPSAGFSAAVCIVLATALFPAFAQDAGDAAAGAVLARTWCSDCHVVNRQQARGNDAVPSFPAVAAAPGTTSMSLRAFLTTPHGRMPDLKLSHTEIDDLVAYILSFRHL